MIITADSPFRRLHANLDPRQACFLDGIRISAEMLDVAYTRLTDLLWQATNQDKIVGFAPLVLDAWAIIDSVHRLRHLLDEMPRLKKNTPKYKLFEKKTRAVIAFRNTIQHLRGEMTAMADHGWPVWGELSWLAVVDRASGEIQTCTMVPGRVQSGSRHLINPVGKSFTGPIDHVTLTCKSDRVSVSELYTEAEKIIKALEPSLCQQIEGQPTQAADIIVKVICIPNDQPSPPSSAPSPCIPPSSSPPASRSSCRLASASRPRLSRKSSATAPSAVRAKLTTKRSSASTAPHGCQEPFRNSNGSCNAPCGRTERVIRPLPEGGSGKVKPSASLEMLDVVEVLQKAIGDKFRVGSLVKDTVRISQREDRQAFWGAVSANRRFKRVVAIVIAIGGDEKQAFRLAFAPHVKVR
jgi:hypothetical protein